MKKIYFAIGIGVILILLIGFWVYSFLYGKEENTPDFFTDLGIFGNGAEEVPVTIPVINEPVVDVATAKLRQLTTRPVIGMRLFGTEDNRTMRYVEAGTGHVYDIDMQTGQENRISQISIPIASEAKVSSDGDYIAVRSGYNTTSEVVVLDLTNDSTPVQKSLTARVESFAFSYTNELLYTEVTNGETEGKGYTPSTGMIRRLFTVPFAEAMMAWSESSTTPHHIYTKPASKLSGYVYEIRDGQIKRLPITGLGLAAAPVTDGLLFGQTVNNLYLWSHFTKSTSASVRVPLNTAPEKCISSTDADHIAYCGAIIDNSVAVNYPDNWNKGTFSADDRIIAIKNSGGYTQLANPLQLVGRSIDVINMSIDSTGALLYFLNKTDRTLWVYDLSS